MSAAPGHQDGATLPENCRTRLECRICGNDTFRACWNWTPAVACGTELVPRWEIDCIECGMAWPLPSGGPENVGEIHDAEVDVRLFRRQEQPTGAPDEPAA